MNGPRPDTWPHSTESLEHILSKYRQQQESKGEYLKEDEDEFLSPSKALQISLAVVEILVDGADKDMMKAASRFITPDDYEQVIVERNILHRCGYPLCPVEPKDAKNIKFKIGYTKDQHGGDQRPEQYKQLAQKLGLPSSFSKQYCSKEHFQSSVFYRAQLSDEAVWARANIACSPLGSMKYERQMRLLEDFVTTSKPSSDSFHNSRDRQLAESISKLDIQTDDSTTNVPRQAASIKGPSIDFDIKERSPDTEMQLSDTSPPPASEPSSIEGYRPWVL